MFEAWRVRRRDAGDERWDGRAGRSSGGPGRLLVGLTLAAAGGYLILTHARVTSGYWGWWGGNTFGLTLVPLLLGVGLLFVNGRSLLGWLLAGGGLVIIIVGIIANLHLYFPLVSLYNLLIMAGLFVGGLALIADSFRRR